jgi:uncharacterized protein (TIGR04255 family)
VRPFKTPLTEVAAQIDLSTAGLVEFRARSFYAAIQAEYPQVQRLPVVLVGDSVPNQQFHLPAYRFFTGDGKGAVQLGPRMMSVNALSWEDGFEGYRSTLHSIMDRYVAAMQNELVLGFSLGFYNRIPTQDIAEAREIYRLQLSDEDVLFRELSYQSVQMTRAGIVVTQVATAQPEERMPEHHLIVNNIVRMTPPGEQRPVRDVVEEWRAWIEVAHDVAKEVFWNSLTPEAQTSWKETAPN